MVVLQNGQTNLHEKVNCAEEVTNEDMNNVFLVFLVWYCVLLY